MKSCSALYVLPLHETNQYNAGGLPAGGRTAGGGRKRESILPLFIRGVGGVNSPLLNSCQK